jgi:hypothetical protein
MGKFLRPNLPPEPTPVLTPNNNVSTVVSFSNKIKISLLLMFLLVYPLLCSFIVSYSLNIDQNQFKRVSGDIHELQQKVSELRLYSFSNSTQYTQSDLLSLKDTLEKEIEIYNNKKSLITNELHFSTQIKKMNELDTHIIKCTIQIKEITNLLNYIKN